MSDTVLRFESVSLHRDGQALVNSIDLNMSAGKMLAVLGPNGAGKTSLLNCVNSVSDFSGTILLKDRSVADYSPQQRAKILAMLPQQSALSFPFSVKEVIMLGRYPHNTGSKVDTAITDELLAMMQLSALADRCYTSLSGGEQQRTQIARVLSQLILDADMSIRSGSVLLLDEPVSSLDLSHQSSLMVLLKEFCGAGLAIAVVLHDLNLAAAYADQCALLKGGQLLVAGKPEQVITAESIRQAYGIEVEIIAHPKTAKPLVIREF